MKAYFTDIRTRIAERIEKAESSIKIAMAWFTNQVLFQLLLDKAAGGTKVELIISGSETNFVPASALKFEALQKKGAKVSVMISYGGYQFMHHKFAIIDEKEVITGSYNWSSNAHSNYENIVILSDLQIAKAYVLQFEKLLQNDITKSFDEFKALINFTSIQDAVHADEAMAVLARKFSEAVTSAMQEAKSLDLGIRIDIIDGMIKRYSAVGAARKLSNDEEQSGFLKLVTENRPDLTFEYLTAKSRFEQLFDKVTIKNAKEKLRPYLRNEVDDL